jgi:hypothetical protein
LIRFFSINDPLKLLIALFLLVIIRVALIISGIPLTISEIEWFAVGEKINNGFLLYKEIWTDIPPLSALVFATITYLFGKSTLALQILSIIVVMIQITIFSFAINQYDTQTEKNYLGSFIYALMASIYVGFNSLSPALLSATFALLALHNLLYIIKNGPAFNSVFYTGIWISISTLFFFPNIAYLVAILATLLILTKLQAQSVFVFLFAFMFPYACVGIYFYANNAFAEFDTHFIDSSLILINNNFFGLETILYVFGFAILVFLLSIAMLVSSNQFINFQTRCHQLMFFWLICGAFSFFISDKITLTHFTVMLPAVVFVNTQYFLLLKNNWKTNLYFSLFVFYLVIISFANFRFNLDFKSKILADITNIKHTNKRILNLGESNLYYFKNSLATPFLEWKHAEYLFKNLENYRNIATIYDGIKNDMPEIIIDENNYFEQVLEKIPEFKLIYKKTGNTTWEKI